MKTTCHKTGIYHENILFLDNTFIPLFDSEPFDG